MWKYCVFAGISVGKFFIKIYLAPDGLYLLILLIFINVGQCFTVKFIFYLNLESIIQSSLTYDKTQ